MSSIMNIQHTRLSEIVRMSSAGWPEILNGIYGRQYGTVSMRCMRFAELTEESKGEFII